MAKAIRIDDKGVYHATCHIGRGSSIDGEPHDVTMSGTPRKKFKAESVEDFELFLNGYDLSLRPKAKADSGFAAATVKVSDLPPEEQAKRKVAQQAARTVKKMVREESAATSSIVRQSGISDEQLAKVLKDAGLI